MADPGSLLAALARHSAFNCVGVPDSTLAPFFERLSGDSRFTNLIATNECEATAIAMGQYLGGAGPSLVYLQNSGFGKTIHPITSLLAREICAIPALLLIGWRGCPDPELKPDEPQHAKMGRIMPGLLKAIEVPYEILAEDDAAVAAAVDRAFVHFAAEKTPYALIVRPGLFGREAAGGESVRSNGFRLKRKAVLERVTAALPADTLYVSTTGKTSRELYAIREERGQPHDSDFYTVGGMGCASAIALGVATSQPRRTVCVLDGDGAALMHLGNLATIGKVAPKNLIHVLVDNQAHESTGGQPTASATADLGAVARACGYARVLAAGDDSELTAALGTAAAGGPVMIVVRSALGSDPKLGRPTRTPRENAESFYRKPER